MRSQIKLLLLFSLLLQSFISYSQNITASNLINYYRNDFDQFDTDIQKKDFDYISIEPRTNEAQIAKYAFKKTIDNGYYTEVFKKIKFKTGVNLLDYQTDKKNDYLKIKKQLKAFGFISNKSKNQGSNTIFSYRSANSKYKDIYIQIAVGTVENSKGKKQVVFEFTLHDDPNM